ncbi:MAG: TIGR03618 family F420-dependent PPOX class oxidoreductase [Dehalococcoidia bacterium]
MAVLTAEQAEFLKAHRLAVLGTGKKDGSPQLSTIMYLVEGDQIVLGVSNDRAKWFNAKRQPKVALLVLDGRKQLIVYGTAECIAGEPERAAITRRIRKAVGTNVPADDLSDEDYGKQLDEQKRVIIRITPTSAFSND